MTRRATIRTAAPAGQDGSALIEVLVSAVVLLIAIVALFSALDVQTQASGDTRASSTAASLAEQDQERMRGTSALTLVTTENDTTRTEVLAGASYTVRSRAEYYNDASGSTDSCVSTAKEAQYLRLTSVVTPPGGVEPVTIRSLMAAPLDRGTLTVKVVGAADQAIQGATATVTGPVTLSATTNTLGCAVFSGVPAGNYATSAQASGFVDPSGNATATGTVTASAGTVNVTTLTYDRAARIDVTFETKVGAAATQSESSQWVSVANAGVASSTCAGRTGVGVRLFCSTSGPQGALAATNLFPFTAPYVVYAGSCPSANPALYDSTYFNTAGRGSVVAAAGTTTAVKVREPALGLTVETQKKDTPVHVRAKSTDAGCSEVSDWNVTTNSSKTATLPTPGLPFGTYSVCADAVVSGNVQRKTITSVPLTSAAGSAAQTIDLSTTAAPAGTTAGTGACT